MEETIHTISFFEIAAQEPPLNGFFWTITYRNLKKIVSRSSNVGLYCILNPLEVGH